MPAQVIKMLDLPPKVDIDDLLDPTKGRLYSDYEQELVEAVLLPEPMGRYSKKMLNQKLTALEAKDHSLFWSESQSLAYSVLKDKDGTLYAIYKGEKQGKLLGQGTFGKVKFVQSMQSGEWQVDKVFPPHPENTQNNVVWEHQALTAIGASWGEVIKNDEKYNIVMRYCRGNDLYDYFHDLPELSALRLLKFCLSSIEALQKLHQKGILHCDIKPENMIINPSTGEVAFVDLGQALALGGDRVVYATQRGTPPYVAPEVDFTNRTIRMRMMYTRDKLGYSTATDIFALGLTLHCVCQYSYSLQKIPQLTSLFKDMRAYFPSCRPTLQTLHKKFKKLQDQLLSSAKEMTGLISINDYLALPDVEREMFLKSLKSFDETILVDSVARHNFFEYTRIKQQFEKKGVAVNSKVLVSPDPNELLSTASDLHQEEKKERTVPRVFFFYPHKAPVLPHLLLQPNLSMKR